MPSARQALLPSRTAEPVPSPSPASVPAATEAPLLQLQRTVGNRAVRRLLARGGPLRPGRTGPNVVARKGEKPDLMNGRLFGQLPEDQRKNLQEITGIEKIAVPDDKKVQNVALKPEFEPGIPAKFEAPLTNVLDYLLRSWLKPNTTAAVELDLTKHDGVATVWRFTYVDTPKDTRYLIDLITNQSAAPPPTPADGGKFKAHKFSVVSSDTSFEPVVRQAVERVPDAFLSQIEGITFKRASAAAKDPDKTGGQYNPEKHEVTIFDVGMKTGSSRYDDNAGYAAPLDERAREVLHEIGHAIDEVALKKALDKRQAARADLESKYPGKVKFGDDGSLTFDTGVMPLDELKVFNQDVDKFKKAKDAADKTLSETGVGLQGTKPSVDTEFKKALDADGTRPLTPYVADKLAEFTAEKDAKKRLEKQGSFLEEAYAEAFSLYISEPQTLRTLRPNTFAFFEKKQKGLEKAAAKKP